MNVDFSKLLSEKNHLKWLVFFAIIFFLIYSYFSYSSPVLFNSPDETANYYFSKLFANERSLSISEELNQKYENIIHPRSINVNQQGELVPTSFLGIFLIYGTIAKIFGTWIIIFLTPLLAVISVICFYFLIKKLFSSKIAFLSSMFLYILPPFMYFSSRSMFHNVLFVSLLIIGFCLLTKINRGGINWKSVLISLVSGLILGLALITRYSEVVWVGFSLLILAIVYFEKRKLIYYLLILLMIGLCFVPILIYNNQLYGDYFITGYSNINTQQIISGSATQENILSNVISNFYNYFVKYLWWIFIPMLFGIIAFLKNKKTLKQKVYLLLLIVSGVWLIYFYGKINFIDNINETIEIGSAYFRYWMPIYIFSLPFIALFFINIKSRWFRHICLYVFMFLCLYVTIWGTSEALANIKQDVLKYNQVKEKVLEITEQDSIITGERVDKIFFPERKVIELMQRDDIEKIYQNLPVLSEKTNVYYFTVLGGADINYLNQTEFEKYGFSLIECKPVYEFNLCKVMLR